MVLLLEMVRDSVADKVLAEKENAGNRSKTEKSTPLMSLHNILVLCSCFFPLSLFAEKIICKFEDLFFRWRYRTCIVLNAWTFIYWTININSFLCFFNFLSLLGLNIYLFFVTSRVRLVWTYLVLCTVEFRVDLRVKERCFIYFVRLLFIFYAFSLLIISTPFFCF